MSETIYYKYRADSLFTEQIITSGRVYLSTAEGLNDPFECSLQEIGRDWLDIQIREMKEAAVAGFLIEAGRALKGGAPFFGLNRAEIERMLLKFRQFNNISESFLYRSEIMKSFIGYAPANPDKLFSQLNQQLLDVGIFSLSSNPNQQLMWAHYAAEHTGLSLGFKKLPGSRLADPVHFLPVIYSDQLPEMKEGFNVEMTFSMSEAGMMYTSAHKIAFHDQTFQKAITTKPVCWEYEEEWRYVEPYPGLFKWPGPLCEITFGLKCPSERRKHYIDIVEAHIPYPVKFFEMRKRHGTNALDRLVYEIAESSPKIAALPDDPPPFVDDKREMTEAEFIAKMERLIRQGNYGEVIFQVQENLNNNPDNGALLNLMGIACGMAQQPDKALECFNKITKLYPDLGHGWYQAACALIELDRNEEALEALKKAYAINPKDLSTVFNLGIVLFKTGGEPHEAIGYLKQAERLGHRRAHEVITEIGRLAG